MSSYELQADEVVLCKAEVKLDNTTTQLRLTNLNIILQSIVRDDENVEFEKVNVYSVQDIKIYKDIPQLLLEGKNIEIYFIGKEVNIEFLSVHEAKKFRNAAFELITDKTRFVRGTEKMMDKINYIDKTFDVDTIGAVKSGAKQVANGIKNFGGGKISIGFGNNKDTKALTNKKK